MPHFVPATPTPALPTDIAATPQGPHVFNLAASPPVEERIAAREDDIVAVRYELDNSLRPHIRQTLRFGEQARYHTMGRYGRMFGGHVSPVLSGHEGTKPAQGHQHAYFLPTDEDQDGFIDHLTVYARGGFDTYELKALQSLSFLTWHRDKAIRFISPSFLKQDELHRIAAFEPGTRWRSVTPMVLFRHPKKYRRGDPKLNPAGRQIDGPEDQLYREWGYWQQIEPERPDLATVRIISGHKLRNGDVIRWLSYMRRRPKETTRTTNLAFGFEIEFKTPVGGPIAIGYGAHFGLGQFL